MLAAAGLDDRENAVVAEGRGRAADRRPQRKQAAAVMPVEIRRREDLKVPAQIAGRLAGAADPSAAGHTRPSGSSIAIEWYWRATAAGASSVHAPLAGSQRSAV